MFKIINKHKIIDKLKSVQNRILPRYVSEILSNAGLPPAIGVIFTEPGQVYIYAEASNLITSQRITYNLTTEVYREIPDNFILLCDDYTHIGKVLCDACTHIGKVLCDACTHISKVYCDYCTHIGKVFNRSHCYNTKSLFRVFFRSIEKILINRH